MAQIKGMGEIKITGTASVSWPDDGKPKQEMLGGNEEEWLEEQDEEGQLSKSKEQDTAD